MAWLFQVNPTYYDIDGALSTGNPLPMSLRQYANDVAVGEPAVLWKSGAGGGIIASGAIAAIDRHHPPFAEWERPFIRVASVGNDYPKAILDLACCPVLHRSTLKDHPVLSQLLVLRRPNNTVYRIDPSDWQELAELLPPGDA